MTDRIRIKREDAEEFTQSLGQIVGGSWRQIALAKRLGVPKALGLSVEDWVNKRLGGYIRLTVEDRRKAIEELVEQGESARGAAKILGVDESTVRDDLAAGNSAPERFAQRDDQETIAGNSAPAPLDAVAALAVTAAAIDRPHVSNNGGENEWYTPPEFIEAAREAMGRIDCDPATSAIANRTVRAETFYTARDDGVKQRWHGAVWMNPPYAQPLIAQFAEAVASKFTAGEIEQACVLVNNATETQWFACLARSACALCLLEGRVKYLDHTGKPANSPLQGQVVLYLGQRVEEFASAFASVGNVWVPHGRTG